MRLHISILLLSLHTAMEKDRERKKTHTTLLLFTQTNFEQINCKFYTNKSEKEFSQFQTVQRENEEQRQFNIFSNRMDLMKLIKWINRKSCKHSLHTFRMIFFSLFFHSFLCIQMIHQIVFVFNLKIIMEKAGKVTKSIEILRNVAFLFAICIIAYGSIIILFFFRQIKCMLCFWFLVFLYFLSLFPSLLVINIYLFARACGEMTWINSRA